VAGPRSRQARWVAPLMPRRGRDFTYGWFPFQAPSLPSPAEVGWVIVRRPLGAGGLHSTALEGVVHPLVGLLLCVAAGAWSVVYLYPVVHPLLYMLYGNVLGVLVCCCLSRWQFGFWIPWDLPRKR
jgi:hypothetical protein